jgi:YHS domain-containing protein
MKKTQWITMGSIAVLLMAGGAMSALAGGEALSTAPATTNVVKHQTICPIEGGEVNRNLFADFGGKRVYFCCAMCPPVFKKDPAKYIKKMEDEGITLDKTPVEPAKKDTNGAPVQAREPAPVK